MSKPFTTQHNRNKQPPNVAAAHTCRLVSFVILAVGLGGLAFGIDWAWIAFPVGYGFVLPVVVARARNRAKSETHATKRRESDKLDTLQERYVIGEIDENEFENHLDQLLKNDDIKREQY